MSDKPVRKKNTIMLVIFFGLLMILSPMLFFLPSGSGENSAALASPAVTQTYTVYFHESGLPAGSSWSVVFSKQLSSKTAYVNFTGISGGTTQTFSVSSVTASNEKYVPTPSSGTVYVDNSNVTVQVSFYNQTTSLPPATGHDLNFTIPNFPSVMPGVTWSWTATVSGVTLPYGPTTSSASTTNSLDYFKNLANGTYSYSLSPAYGTSLSPATGQVTINSRNTTVSVNITLLKTYTVQLFETGLPSDQSFSVSVYDAPTGGSHYSDTNTTYVSQHNYVEFFLINQTYDYAVSSPSGYSASPSSGTLTVSGSSMNATIQFSVAKPTYPVKFQITNPPADTPGVSWFWGVTVNGTFYGNSYNDTLSIQGLASGDYSYITSWYGIALSPLSGAFKVNGTGVTVMLRDLPSWEAVFKIQNLADSAFGYPSFKVDVTTNSPGIGGGSIAGSPFTSTGGEVVIPALPNDTYYYTLTSTDNYFTIGPTSGFFTMSGKNSTIDLSSTLQPAYSVQFVENGLVAISGISWGVVVDNGFFYNDSTPIPGGGLSHVTAPNSVVDSLPQGTYWVQAFVIDSGGKYHFMSPEKITVGSSDNMYTMQFVTGTGSGGFLGISLSTGDYYIIGGVAAAVVAGAVTLFVLRKRGGQGP